MTTILWFLRSKPNFIISKMKEITLNKDDTFLQRNQNRIYSRGNGLCVLRNKWAYKKAFANKNGGDLSFG